MPLLFCAALATGCSKNEASVTPENQVSNGDIRNRDGGGNVCNDATVTLLAGQTIPAGNIVVEQDATNIYVTYNTTDGWVLSATHLYVGACATIPVNPPGNPIPGQFPYNATHNNVTSYTVTIPVSVIGLNNCGCVAAHAVVKKLSATGSVLSSQSAWGQGTVINPQGSWGMKFDFCAVDCD